MYSLSPSSIAVIILVVPSISFVKTESILAFIASCDPASSALLTSASPAATVIARKIKMPAEFKIMLKHVPSLPLVMLNGHRPTVIGSATMAKPKEMSTR